MLKNSTRIRRALLAAALTAGVAGVAAGPADATANVTTSRLAGNDRYGTAAAVATNAYPSGADTVLVASGRSFPDALAGAALAARQAGPVLLTEPNSLPSATSSAIDTLKATKAVILGGTTAVSQAVQTELAKKVTVTRISGTNRYDTAAKIAASIGAANVGSTGGGKAALIATGANFADALAGGALSAAGAGGVFPVLLVDSGIPSQTRSALTELGIKQTIILGGTSAVSQAVADELQQITGNAPTRLAGDTRYATATAIATSELGTFGFTNAAVYLANGENFADALAGGALGGKNKTPILLTPAGSLAGATSSFLNAHKDTIATITAFGGTAAISDAVLAAAKAAAQGEATPPPAIAVAPTGDASQTSNGSATRTYTASNLTGPVDIALLDCDGINTTKKFDNANNNTIADGTANGGDAPDKAEAPGTISTVNGAPNLASNQDFADDATPSDGTVTFVVTAPSGGTGCSLPVVFYDANGDDALNGSAASPMTPSETFGTGGETTYSPATAGSGSFSGRTITSIDTGNDTFVACQPLGQQCLTYSYDSGDTYSIDDPQVESDPAATMATFEEVASTGDAIEGNYNPGGKSEFFLDDSSPAAPDPVTATLNPTNGQITVSFRDSSTSTVESYRLFRAAVPDNGACPDPVEEPGEYTQLIEIADGNSNSGYSYTDFNAKTPATTYCYRVVSVDETGDVGPYSASPSDVGTLPAG